MEEFGDRLFRLRVEKGYTQMQLAEKSGIQQGMISAYESNVVQPTVKRIEWFCKALGVTATELLGF